MTFAEEWPLLLFTLFTQFAVGTYIFFVVIRAFNNKLGKEKSVKLTGLGMTVVGPVMAVALILSLFHLGTPMGAYRAILNWDSSWLSREIIFAGTFFVLWLVGYVMERKGAWSQVLGWINSLVGVAAIYSMASIYASTIMPAWTDVNTYFSFFGTTIVFGAAGTVLFILMSKEEKTDQVMSVLKVTGIIGIAAIALQLIYLPIYASSLAAGGGVGVESAAVLAGDYLYTTIFRWVLTMAGLAIILFGVFRKTMSKTIYQWSMAALVLVLAGEFLGRLIFYASGFPINIG